jgi:hypothetical protein
MRHLDEASVRALLRDEAEALLHFSVHLGSSCEECEAFLRDAPLLDGEVDALLLRVAAPRVAAPIDEAGFEQVQRAARPRRPWRLVGSVAAMSAAGLMFAIFVPPREPTPLADDSRGIKGSANIGIELSAAAKSTNGALRRLDADTTLSDREVVVIRYHANEAGAALLLQRNVRGEVHVLREVALQPGSNELRDRDGILGISLEGEHGPLEIWIVAAPTGTAVDTERVRAEIAAGGAPSAPGLTSAHFRVNVDAKQNPEP